MWHWALEWSRTRKARRAAVSAISPIVEDSRHRLGGISDIAWSDPYIIGFMVMLISIIARMQSGKMSEDSLCLVQCRAWEDITAMQSDLMAEQLLLLSTDRNRDFELGCHNAAAFSSVLFGTTTLQEGVGLPSPEGWPDEPESETTSAFAQREDVNDVWAQFFDVHIAEYAQNVTPTA
jgi:hypothetical protein